MKPRVSHQKTAALTLVEVLLIIFVLFVLAALLLPATSHRGPAKGAMCLNNLKQVGIASLVWAGDHNGKFLMQISVTDGGAKELALKGDVVGIFQAMSNDLNTPKILWCPADTDHVMATNFAVGFSAKNISYFVCLDAATDHPQTFLSGDDNLAIGGVPVKSGLLEFSTNTPIAFTSERHRYGGNIVSAEGFVRAVGAGYSLDQMLVETGVATNRLAIP